MILLDTNVISEPIKLAGDVKVLTWLDAQMVETLYLSTISLAELRFGIASMPTGKRKDTLHTSLEQRILPLFSGRILAFESNDRSLCSAASLSKGTRPSDCSCRWLYCGNRHSTWLDGRDT